MFDWIASPEAWIALFTLTALEIVLGHAASGDDARPAAER